MHVHGAGDRLRSLFKPTAPSPGRTWRGPRFGRVNEAGIDFPQFGLAQTEAVERTGPLAAEQDVRAGHQVDEALFPVGTLDVDQDCFLAPADAQPDRGNPVAAGRMDRNDIRAARLRLPATSSSSCCAVCFSTAAWIAS